MSNTNLFLKPFVGRSAKQSSTPPSLHVPAAIASIVTVTATAIYYYHRNRLSWKATTTTTSSLFEKYVPYWSLLEKYQSSGCFIVSHEEDISKGHVTKQGCSKGRPCLRVKKISPSSRFVHWLVKKTVVAREDGRRRR